MNNNLKGRTFGKLTCIGNRYKENGYYYQDCLCECSQGFEIRPIVKVKEKYLLDNSTRSCGCLRKEHAKDLSKDNNKVFSNSEIKELPYYKEIKMIWTSNRDHCYNAQKAHSYYRKGLKFCTEWDCGFLGFLRFYLWCIDSNGYIGSVSQLDRIDKNKGFSPQNCKLIYKPKKKEAPIKQNSRGNAIENTFSNVLLATSNEVKVKLMEFLNSVGIDIK